MRTTKFTGDEHGNVKQLHTMRVGPPPKFEPIPCSETTIEADLVLLAMGFTGPVRKGMLEEFGIDLDARGNVATKGNYVSSVPGIFCGGGYAQRPVTRRVERFRRAAAQPSRSTNT